VKFQTFQNKKIIGKKIYMYQQAKFNKTNNSLLEEKIIQSRILV